MGHQRREVRGEDWPRSDSHQAGTEYVAADREMEILPELQRQMVYAGTEDCTVQFVSCESQAVRIVDWTACRRGPRRKHGDG